jgi:hypothetical protein
MHKYFSLLLALLVLYTATLLVSSAVVSVSILDNVMRQHVMSLLPLASATSSSTVGVNCH